MVRILYLTSTCWWWAKQRPQFIAEELSGSYEVTYVYFKTYRTSNIVKNRKPIKNSNLKLLQIFRLPFERFRLIRYINKWLFVSQIRFKINHINMIWITNPIIYNQLKSIIPQNIPVYYDCMDDHIEFPSIKADRKKLKEVLQSEKALSDISAHIFFSARHLKDKVMERYKLNKKFTIINNAIEVESFGNQTAVVNPLIIDGRYNFCRKLVYTGTISTWFDFSLIHESLARFTDIIYILVGPREVDIPHNDRLLYFGPVSHDKIKGFMNYSDALIMPFIDSDLIRSVNPVKVYEYISSCKPAIILRYDETDKFDDYVYRYNDKEEYFHLIEQLVNNNLKAKKSRKECLSFAAENTWRKRAVEIIASFNP